MKKITSIIIILCLLIMFSGCGNTKIIDGIEYDTYGLINKEEKRNPDIKYRLIIGNIVWSAILCETIIAPIYFIGFSIYEPYRKAIENEPIGSL